MSAKSCGDLSEVVLKHHPVDRREISTSGYDLSCLHRWETSCHTWIVLCFSLLISGEPSPPIFYKKRAGKKKPRNKTKQKEFLNYLVVDKSEAVYNYWKTHSNLLLRNFISTMLSVDPLKKMNVHCERKLWKKLCYDVVCLAWGREKYGIGKL